MRTKGCLVLEDGSNFQGTIFGCAGKEFGEVVFNTGMTGYQRVLTDPSYCGQIIVFTYPLIGNYGISENDHESGRTWVQGIVLKDLCTFPNNWRSVMSLEDFCCKNGIMGITGVDTRALTKHLCSQGTMRGVIAVDGEDSRELAAEACAAPLLSDQNLIQKVTTQNVRILGDGDLRVVVLDFGVKNSILKSLIRRNCKVYLVPAMTTAEEILSYKPHGVLLSNGPGDPKTPTYAVETVRSLIGRVPLMGICLGHQILGLAFGGDTFKLKYGHHGANHPVKDVETGRIYITSQNHGYAVNEASLTKEINITHFNLNDGTIEGFKHEKLPIFSYQFHPEGAAGPLDSTYLFDQFIMSFCD